MRRRNMVSPKLVSCASIAAAAFALVAVAGCGSSSQSPPGHPRTDAITVASTLDLGTLDAILSNNVESSHSINDTLVRIRPDGSLEPGLATKWSGNSDATKWNFTIRSGARFSDGSALTASDVVWTYNTILATDKSLNKPNISPYLTSVSLQSDTSPLQELWEISSAAPDEGR